MYGADPSCGTQLYALWDEIVGVFSLEGELVEGGEGWRGVTGGAIPLALYVAALAAFSSHSDLTMCLLLFERARECARFEHWARPVYLAAQHHRPSQLSASLFDPLHAQPSLLLTAG